MWTTTDVRMNGHGKHESFFAFVLVEVVEVVHPLLFECCCVNLDEKVSDVSGPGLDGDCFMDWKGGWIRIR